MPSPNAPDDSRSFPTHVGNFEIQVTAEGKPWLLGSGTYGETYLVKHRFLETTAAIKVIRERHLTEPKAREQFLAEAKAVARLRHAHIAQVYDFGTIDDGLFYAMEFCAGGNLSEWMKKRGAMSPTQVLAVGQQVASALKCCHTAGFIHRDLKPANLMLANKDGALVVKLIDFGLVHAGHAEESEHGMGTALYASPEQLMAKQVDGRADLFSLGMTLWHLATAQRPDTGTDAAVIQARLSTESYAGRLPSELPEPLRAIIAKLVEVDQDCRPADAASVLEDLNKAAIAMGVPVLNDFVHAPQADPSLAPVREIAASLASEFTMSRMVGDTPSGRSFRAQPVAPNGKPVFLHVIDPAVRGDEQLLNRVRQNVSRLSALNVPGMLKVMEIRSYSDVTAVVLEAPTGSDLQSALKARGKIPASEARPIFETIAAASDNLAAAGLPGIELNSAQIFVPENFGAAASELRLMPRLLAPEDRQGKAAEPAAEDAEATLMPEAVAGAKPEDPTGLFARVLYRAVAGRDVPAAASLAAQAYVPAPELTDEANRALAQAIAKTAEFRLCKELLVQVIREEVSKEREAPAPQKQGVERERDVSSGPARKRGPLIGAVIAAVLAIGGGAAWFALKPKAPGPEAASIEHKAEPVAEPKKDPIFEHKTDPVVESARLPAGTVVRLRSDRSGDAKFHLAGVDLPAKKTESGWDVTLSKETALPTEIVGELPGFNPVTLRVEKPVDVEKPLDFLPLMRKGTFVFTPERGCDYSHIVAKMTKDAAGAPAADRAQQSYEIKPPSPVSDEVEPGYYLLTLQTTGAKGTPRTWQSDFEVRADQITKLTLPPSWVGTYTVSLKVSGTEGSEERNGKLKIEPDFSGTFSDEKGQCRFAKGRMDSNGDLAFQLKWSSPAQGEPGYDWKVKIKRSDKGEVSMDADEFANPDDTSAAPLGREAYKKEQWHATGTLKPD